MPTLHHVKICVHFLPTHGPPKLSKIVDGWDAETGQRGFLLRMELEVNDADERFCVGRLRVLTEGR